MGNSFTIILVGSICLFIGLCIGAEYAPELKTTAVGQYVESKISATGLLKVGDQKKDDTQFESYDYPTIKWKPKPLADSPNAIGRLWTTYDSKSATPVMKYKLTLFKATNTNAREVQLVDAMGFKLVQFSASDFIEIPGAPDIVEARDSVSCTEDQYKKARDYSVK
jgi:hypothetical protein